MPCRIYLTTCMINTLHSVVFVFFVLKKKKSILVLIPEEYNTEPQARFFKFKLIHPILKSCVNKAIMGTSLTTLIILESHAEWMKA